jgi:hypothetical protein
LYQVLPGTLYFTFLDQVLTHTLYITFLDKVLPHTLYITVLYQVLPHTLYITFLYQVIPHTLYITFMYQIPPGINILRWKKLSDTKILWTVNQVLLLIKWQIKLKCLYVMFMFIYKPLIVMRLIPNG